MGIRKNVVTLTAKEKSAFVAALLELKQMGHYDHLVHIHHQAMMDIRPDPAHGGPAFFPWHRYYLRQLEVYLQEIDPSVSLPYWDWTRERSRTGPPWTDDLMGGNGRENDGKVTTGPFAYSTGDWPITVKDWRGQPTFLTRFMSSPSQLPQPPQVYRIMQRVHYDTRPWNWGSDSRESFRAALEGGPHNFVHVWVGGNMGGAGSPNDPVFFLHHAMVDRLWAKWQKRHRGTPYKPGGQGPRGHNRDDRMWPWRALEPAVTPKSVLDHQAMGYGYDDEASW